VPDRLRRKTIVTEQEALLVRAGHPLTRRAVTKEALLSFPHVVVELTGSEEQGLAGFIDDRGVMRRNWIERLLIESNGSVGPAARVVVTVPTYAPVPQIVAMTDLIATLPRRLAEQAAQSGTVVMLDLPYEPLEVNIEAIWHMRADRDPALTWLIGELMSVTGAL
jgi:DNA-binding transcriptional LysR family regulator